MLFPTFISRFPEFKQILIQSKLIEKTERNSYHKQRKLAFDYDLKDLSKGNKILSEVSASNN